MKQDRPLLPRGQLKSDNVLKLFPLPTRYAMRSPGSYSLSGAYLMSRGLVGDDPLDDSVRYPQAWAVSDQLQKDNHLLSTPARGL